MMFDDNDGPVKLFMIVVVFLLTFQTMSTCSMAEHMANVEDTINSAFKVKGK